jgi:hypothetical protein
MMSYWCIFWQQNNYIQRRLSNKFPHNYSNYIIGHVRILPNNTVQKNGPKKKHFLLNTLVYAHDP